MREGDDIRRLYGTVRSALGLTAIVVAVALGVAAVHRIVVVPPAPIEVAADTPAAVGSGAFHKIDGERVRDLTGAASKSTDPRVDPSDPSESGSLVPDGSGGPDAPGPASGAVTTSPGGLDDGSGRGGNPGRRIAEAPGATPVPAPTAPGTTRGNLPTIPPVTAPRVTVPPATVPRVPGPWFPGPTVTLPTVTLPTLPGPKPTLPPTTVPVSTSTPTITIPPIIITIPGL